MVLMATEKPARVTDDMCNAELSAAVHDRSNWSVAYLGKPTLEAMYAPADDVRGFVFPHRNADGVRDGWVWFVLHEKRGRVNPQGDPVPSAEDAVRLVEASVATTLCTLPEEA